MLFMRDPINIWSFVYFFQVESGLIKIGKTDNPEKRRKELQTANHEKLELLHYTTGGRALEKHLHEKFKKYNKSSEWFWPEDEIIKFIDSIRVEDEYFGRIDSIVSFALKQGYKIPDDDKETLVELTRGTVISWTPHIEKKLVYWNILDAYEKYLQSFPQYMIKRRRISVWRNEGNQLWDKEIKKRLSIS